MLSRTTKLKLNNTLIVPVLIYGAEEWTFTDERMLHMFERKVLRTIYGPVCVDGEWRTCYNHELYSFYKGSQIPKKKFSTMPPVIDSRIVKLQIYN